MRAAWYDKQGAARDVLQTGELPAPEPAPGEVRVRIELSGIHVGDIGKRQGYWGSVMTYPRVIPHGDGVGVIDAVGNGVAAERIGERVWVYLAQSYRPGGTAAEYTVVPADRAVVLPAQIDAAQAAGLGIPGITGHRAIMAGGSVAGSNVLVTGATGAVGRAALATARRGGATVLATVRRAAERDAALKLGAHHAFIAGPDLRDQIVDAVGAEAIDLVADLAFDKNIELATDLLRYGGSIATYATGETEPAVPFWQLAFKNVTVRFLSNDDFPEAANQDAARDLTAALTAGDLHYDIRATYPLDQIAAAHEDVEQGSGTSRVLVEI
ncbi:NADPH:quinone reductase [Kribbella sandramycini]|uniref:NADPH2:quinone reductase n=1 Tax=Kribbella sandramycini TaxID=60450 RepID=A0A7Y4KVC5_9ACTN|nr:NADPH:quinone reductase [Kribbella sandramycini]MBB6568002.1 NADPH2:quinone reductase [Kribbella sandramycini]NOL39404.1 NADPH:quinone reductase [Kribbella sandramycini]